MDELITEWKYLKGPMNLKLNRNKLSNLIIKINMLKNELWNNKKYQICIIVVPDGKRKNISVNILNRIK